MDQKIKNGHLPLSMGWISYKLQLWPGVRYGNGIITNNLEEAQEMLNGTDNITLNAFGIARTVEKVGE